MLVVGILVAAIWVGFRLLKRKLATVAGSMSALVQRGINTTGRVTSVERRRMSRGQFEYFMTYAFEASDGTTHEKELRIQRLDEFAEGQPIEIVYLGDDPSQSALRVTVDDVRGKMGEGPLRK